MAKRTVNADGSVTYYPKEGEKRTGTSTNKGKTYKAGKGKKASPGMLGTGAASSAGKKLKNRKSDLDRKIKKSGG